MDMQILYLKQRARVLGLEFGSKHSSSWTR